MLTILNIQKIARISLVAVVLTTAGCNTVEGMGKDIGKAGDAISDGAENTKKKM